jgi:hypothetical protein
LIYRKSVLPLIVCKNAYSNLRDAALAYDGASNRGTATGNFRVIGGENIVKVSRGGQGNRLQNIKKDGTLSKTNRTISDAQAVKNIIEAGAKVEQELSDGSWIEVEPEPRASGVVGYVDRSPRFPYCRLTAFNINHPDKFRAAMPLIRRVGEVFAESCPERYAAQMDVVQNTVDDYVISGTPFTTITVNMNFQTAVHQDAGDLKAGFGVMSALRAGRFDGCYTCFPQYRIAADMQTGDVLLADVHEWHGNTPLKPKGAYERLSLVFYYREKMKECGTPTEELERAKRR